MILSRVLALIVSWLMPLSSPLPALSETVIQDIFGRRLNERGVTIVDWEGHMANPAIKILIVPPLNATFPASATLTADNVRLYFDLPIMPGMSGATKTMSFPNATPVPVYISSAPDRDVIGGLMHVTVQFTANDNQQTTLVLDVHEIDQDVAGSPPFSVIVTFAQDQTGFFSQPARTAIVQQAANDWAYFIGNMQLDQVAAGAESTFIWDPTSFQTGHFVTNAQAYTGFLLYATGIHTAALRSGGGPANSGFQTSSGVDLHLRRSGGYQCETAGNFNMLGWFLTTGDDDWWISGNQGNEPNDLYSIAHHEMGHALVFNPAYPKFSEFKQLGHVNDADVLAYHGSNPNIDGFDHLNGELDNASHRGAYGYEYFGDVPARRWFITKLDLLVAKAIGYTLRQTSAFVPLAITTAHVHFGTISQPYTSTVAGAGGIPFYNWTLDSGSLPPGLSLNAFTGAISGTPTAIGTYNFSVRLQEYLEGSTGVTMPFSIIINSPFTDASIVANSTVVRAVHVAELRSRVDALRARDGLAPVVWTDPTLTPGVTAVRALHIAELRTALTQVYAQEMMTAPVFDPGLGQGLNVKAVHITELRAAVLAIE